MIAAKVRVGMCIPQIEDGEEVLELITAREIVRDVDGEPAYVKLFIGSTYYGMPVDADIEVTNCSGEVL